MTTCSIEGCGLRHQAKGLCNKHRARFLRLGTPHLPPRAVKRCSHDGCTRRHFARGKCATHDNWYNPRGRFRDGQSNAKKRKLTWGLTWEQYRPFAEQPCVYCKEPLSRTGCGLDRIDSSRGYELGNVVTCCGECNRIKSDKLTQAEMFVVGEALRKHRRGEA